MNTDKIAMCYISIDSSQQAIQTYGKLFSHFEFLAAHRIHFKGIERRE